MKNLQLYGICRDYNATGDIMTFCCDCCYLLELELELVWIVKWWVSCLRMRGCVFAGARKRESVCVSFFSHTNSTRTNVNGSMAILCLYLMKWIQMSQKNFFMNDIDGEFYEIEQYTLTMHKICTMWAEYNLAKWKCLSPHVLTLCVDRFSNAVHWFRLGRRHRCCCCCLPFSDVRVNLAWESKQCVTEFIYSVHRPIDTKNDINYGWKRIKTSFVEFPTFFSLFYSFLKKGRMDRRTLVM